MNVVFVEIDRCIACLNCMRVCSFRRDAVHHCQSPRIFVNVDMDQRKIFAGICQQCEAAPCMRICPTGALKRDLVTNAVVVDRNLCICCAMCVMACPFGNVELDEAQRVATKCDLCFGAPKCVQVCMARALHYGSIDELAELKRRRGGLRLAVRAISINEDAGE